MTASSPFPAAPSPYRTDLTLLCKVVDNFGDIGFVYRLARSLSECDPSLKLRLVVSDLKAFKAMASEIDDTAPIQQWENWTIFDWNASKECMEAFSKNPPYTILECFQCNRPQWLDSLLFDQKIANEKHLVKILNLDYLTAEDYAEDFHCLKSGTRSLYVKKWNFMPGFTQKTGGLTLDKKWMESASRCLPDFPLDDKSLMDLKNEKVLTASIFAYERDFTPVVQALSKLDRPVRCFVAAGKSHDPFLSAWEKAGNPFAITELPFLSQSQWDSLLCAVDYNFIRGEDSLSRACLASRPFMWHAYPQETEYQLVKVKALLERMKEYFSKDDFDLLERLWLGYNRDGGDAKSEEDYLQFFKRQKSLTPSFQAFSSSLYEIGNLAEHLLSWCNKL